MIRLGLEGLQTLPKRLHAEHLETLDAIMSGQVKLEYSYHVDSEVTDAGK